MDTFWVAGDYEGARKNSRTALRWNIASIVTTPTVLFISTLVIVIPIAAVTALL